MKRIFYQSLDYRSFLYYLFFGFVLLVLISLPKESAGGVLEGMKLSAIAVIPALFPFMVLSEILYYRENGGWLSRLLDGITKLIFGTGKGFGVVFFVSLLGGYPVGARLLGCQLREGRITPEQQEHYASFLVCSGPGFAVSSVGIVFFRSIQIGLLLYLSQIITVVVMGFLLRFCKRGGIQKSVLLQRKRESFIQVLVDSVKSSATACLMIAAFVSIFFAVIRIFDRLGVFSCVSEALCCIEGMNESLVRAMLLGLVEVTTGCRELAGIGGFGAAAAAAFLLSFSGVSIVLQLLAFLSNPCIRFFRFVGFRLLAGLISSVAFILIVRMLGISVQVFSTSSPPAAALYSVTPLLSILIVITAVFSLLAGKDKKRMAGDTETRIL